MADRMTIEKYFHVVHKLLKTHWAVDDHNVSYSVFQLDDAPKLVDVIAEAARYIFP